MDVLVQNVDVVQKVLKDPATITLQSLPCDPVVFVEVESYDAGKIESILAVHPNQLAVDAQRGRTGGQAKDCLLAQGVSLANHSRHNLCDMPRHDVYIIEQNALRFGAGNDSGTRSNRFQFHQ